jgi:Fic family protein
MIDKEIYDKLSSVYRSMKTRCYSSRNKAYYLYGGKGIRICETWLLDKEKFIAWSMENGYKQGLTIDRIDSNKNYEPLNCRWVDRYVQNNNTSRNTFVTYKNQTHTLAEWSRITGLSYKTICHRHSRNWDTERMFTQKQEIRKL